MIKLENLCVDCGQPCFGKYCPFVDVPVCYCDSCGDNHGEYELDGEQLCSSCAKEILQEMFDELSIEEKAQALNVDFREIDLSEMRKDE